MGVRQAEPESESIALCLSGGGLRATLFHLGVVRALRDADVLRSVTDVFSVSGGSILAAHMVLHWEDYAESGPDDTRFLMRSGAIGEFCLRDTRGRIVRRMTLLGWLPAFGRTRQLESHYAALFDGAELGALPNDAPELHILATSMVTGELSSSSRAGVSFVQNGSARRFPAVGFPLARAVAASSAFPPFFPPVRIDRRELAAREHDFPHDEYLTDGGVYDNLGVHELGRIARARGSFDVIIVSDASAGFDWRVRGRWRGIVSRTARTSDILMRRVASLEEQSWKAREVIPIIIHDVIERLDLPDGRTARLELQDAELQALVGKIRTDLDQFHWREMLALTRHGYEVALHSLHDRRTELLERTKWVAFDPIPTGWPRAPLNHIWMFRAARAIAEPAIELGEKSAKLERTFQQDVARIAGVRTPSPEQLAKMQQLDEARRTSAREQQKERDEWRNTIRRGASRRVRLWDSGDWSSWIWLLLLLGLIALLLLLLT
jgi:predicted acylesterase/phospholipase RssA